MERKPRTVTKRLKALTDPQPEFVSLVKAGANMTPFRAVKADDAGAAADSTGEDTMQKKLKSDTHDIVRITFRGEQFAEKAAVEKWLEDGGYTGYEVVQLDDGFEVKGSDAVTGPISEVTPVAGVTVHIAQKASAAEKAAQAPTTPSTESIPAAVTGVQLVAKSSRKKKTTATPALAESRKRFDEWYAGWTDGKTLDQALAEGFDGLPPGMWEVTTAMYGALRNACYEGDLEAIRALGTEYGNMIADMVQLFPNLKDQQLYALSAFAPEIVIADGTDDDDPDDDDDGVTYVEVTVKTANKQQATKDSITSAPDQKPTNDFKPDSTGNSGDQGATGTIGVMGSNPGNANGAGTSTVPNASGTVDSTIGEMGSNPGNANGATADDGKLEATSTEPTGPTDSVEGDAQTNGVQALSTTVNQLASLIKGLTDALAGVQTSVKEQGEALAQRVEALEGERQSRKGADVGEAGTGGSSPRQKVSEEMAEHRMRSVLGVSSMPRR